MKVILTADVAKLGKKYEVKDVSDGHALNMLIPKGVVEVATPAALKRLELKKKELEVAKARQDEQIAKSLKTIHGKTFEMTQKVNEKGHLFATIHLDEVSALIKSKTNLDLPSSYLHTAKPIKEAGDHEVTVTVGKDTATFNLKISAE